MGRHEPLTSLALGRSPYDDVVEGEGEADLREPPRQYDEHGRVINDESKRKTKDIIRAHNEVMLAIGVAEPEPDHTSPEGDSGATFRREYEDAAGKQYVRWGRILSTVSVWGINSIRHRISVYREPAGLPFLEMLLREGRTHTIPQLLFAGMPSLISAWSLQWFSRTAVGRNNRWLRNLISYVKFHLQIYVILQRLDLIPALQLFPSIGFLIPFSPWSPFMAPPPLGSPGAENLFLWTGHVVASLAPYAGHYLVASAWDVLSRFIRRRLQPVLPQPLLSMNQLRPSWALNAPQAHDVPDSPTLGETDQEIRHQNPELTSDDPSVHDEGSGDALEVDMLRREGTFSSRGGDDYATDEEDPDAVNATMISFDVDLSEGTGPPSGMWSAELRPSNNDDFVAQQREGPRYNVTSLTTLPAVHAADIITSSLSHIIITPLNILVFRALARAFAHKMGLPMGHMFELSLMSGQVSRIALNLVQAEVLKFVVTFASWTLVTKLVQRFHRPEKESEEYESGEYDMEEDQD